MTSSPSLCPLFPSTIHICRLAHENTERDGSHETMDSANNSHRRRRLCGNLNMPLNSSRLPLNPNHIATQMSQHPESPSTPPVQPLRRSARATRRLLPTTRTPTPPPLWTPAPRRNFYRRGAIGGSPSYLDDTRRHGMILEDSEGPVALESDTLPAYTPCPSTLFRRVTADGTPPTRTNPWLHRHDQALRQLELRELQRQWNVRRRSHATSSTERTAFRPLVSEAYDLPPPYAPRDPYPLFKPAEKRPSIWARVVLYPFVPEGELLDKAAFATDRLAKTVVGGVKKGVEEVGKKARAVPRQIESTRAKRKMRWLEGRGYVDRDGSDCGVYAGTYHAGET